MISFLLLILSIQYSQLFSAYLCGCEFSTRCYIGKNTCCPGLTCQLISTGATQCLEPPSILSKKKCVLTGSKYGCTKSSDCCNPSAVCDSQKLCNFNHTCTYDYKSANPTSSPSRRPNHPSSQPIAKPSRRPIVRPTKQPTKQPYLYPKSHPSSQPNNKPSKQPSKQPICKPSQQPFQKPKSHPSYQPVKKPSSQPSTQPRRNPARSPSSQPSVGPTFQPQHAPSGIPSQQPAVYPSKSPTAGPTLQPSVQPLQQPSSRPSSLPSSRPDDQPSSQPISEPTSQPLLRPSSQPSSQPSQQPTDQPTCQTTSNPTNQPLQYPVVAPSAQPYLMPVVLPSAQPSRRPSSQPIYHPTTKPSIQPFSKPSMQSTSWPSSHPTITPSGKPTQIPTKVPSFPTNLPSSQPLRKPSLQPRQCPSANPTATPSLCPASNPSAKPTICPTLVPTTQPSSLPTQQPVNFPSKEPISEPTGQPTETPSVDPTHQPLLKPSSQPVLFPTLIPTKQPTKQPSSFPTGQPSSLPTNQPLGQPTQVPFLIPTKQPQSSPSNIPSSQPSHQQTYPPTVNPTVYPSRGPSSSPSTEPTIQPSKFPTSAPSNKPFGKPSGRPSLQPARYPSFLPTHQPKSRPTLHPSYYPTKQPLSLPSSVPTHQSISFPTSIPTWKSTSRQPVSISVTFTSSFVITNLTTIPMDSKHRSAFVETIAELLNIPGAVVVLLNATTGLSRKLLSVVYSVESVRITATESLVDFPIHAMNATAFLGHLYLVLFSAVYSGKATEVFRLHLKELNARDSAQPAIVAMVLGDKVTSPTASPTNQVMSDGVKAKANNATGNTALIAGILAGTLGLLCAGIPLFMYFRQESKKKQKQANEKDNLKVVSNTSMLEDEKVLVLMQQSLSVSDLYPNLENVVRSKTVEEPNNNEGTPSFANYYDLFAENDDDRVLLYSNLKNDSESLFHNPLLLKQSSGNRNSLGSSRTLTAGSELFSLYNAAEEDGGSFSESRTGENPQHKGRAMSDSEKSPEHPFHVNVIDSNKLITSSKSTPMRPPKAMQPPSSDPVGLKRSKLLSRNPADVGSSDFDEGTTNFAEDRDMPHSQRFRVIQTKFEYLIQKNSRTMSRASSPMVSDSGRESKLVSVSLEGDGSRSRTGSFSTDRAKVFSPSTDKDVS